MWKFRWLRHRMVEIAVALVVVGTGQYVIGNIQDQRKAGVSADQWYKINDIFVPDHMAAEDPLVTYDRTIKVPFRGFWVMEVQRQDDDGSFTLECSGSGINSYDPADYIPNNQVRWSWFVGNKCQTLPAGNYRVRSSWIMKRADWPDKQMVVYSNIFKIM